MTTDALLQSDLKCRPFLHRGKVRDLYAVGEDKQLVIPTDRLSAFDVILPTPIPGKGRVLTKLSNFWFATLGYVIPNHQTGIAPGSVAPSAEHAQVAGRHDENITCADVEKTIGAALAARVREVSIRLYTEAAAYAATRGVIIADSKLEFGLYAANNLVLIDEVLTL